MISESDSSAGHLKQTNCKSHHHEILLSNFPWSYRGISDGNNWKYFMKLEYCQLPNETGTMGLLLQLKETIKKTFIFFPHLLDLWYKYWCKGCNTEFLDLFFDNISIKFSLNSKSKVSFEICFFWGFQNCPCFWHLAK